MTAPPRSSSAGPLPGTAGLILAGGRSSRMGVDKATLRFGPRTLLELALDRMSEVARPIAVSVGADPGPARTVPAVRAAPPEVLWVHDRAGFPGPLWGLAQGFSALEGRAGQVLVMTVDLPFFTPPWMRRAVEGREDRPACLYRWQNFTNALVGAYSLALLPKVERLAAQERRRPMDIVLDENIRVLELEGLWHAEDGPPPLMDTDTPEDYRQALLLGGWGNRAGAPVTVELLDAHGPLAGWVPLAAATAGEALHFTAQLYPEYFGSAPALAVGIAQGEPLKPGAVLRVEIGGGAPRLTAIATEQNP